MNTLLAEWPIEPGFLAVLAALLVFAAIFTDYWARCMNDLARLLLRLLQTAATIRESGPGPDYGLSLLKLAALENKRNNNHEAEVLYSKALALLGDRPEAAAALPAQRLRQEQRHFLPPPVAKPAADKSYWRRRDTQVYVRRAQQSFPLRDRERRARTAFARRAHRTCSLPRRAWVSAIAGAWRSVCNTTQ